MLTSLAGFWKGLPEWVQGLIIGAAMLTGYGILKVLYRREDRKRGIEAWVWLGALLGANWVWGVPGLLILIGFAGGLTAWHFALRADEAEVRRRRRLQFAVGEYLRWEYKWYREDREHRPLDWKVYGDWLEERYDGKDAWALCDEWDEQGTTAEDLHRASERIERRIAELDAGKAKETSPAGAKSSE